MMLSLVPDYVSSSYWRIVSHLLNLYDDDLLNSRMRKEPRQIKSLRMARMGQ
jgi:hypothetical protein